ncbi:ABC transporter permease [Hyphomonas sp. NPDC076900]|uniref:ABC transporter permease n=1 Tax=unclassified Hyphomonas TaxID=2630699 RepID=UPI003D056F69
MEIDWYEGMEMSSGFFASMAGIQNRLIPLKRTMGFRKPDSNSLGLILSLSKREVQAKYRGSLLGVTWSLLTPLLMLGVYTFVFGVVFRSRWATSDTHASPAEFAVILFVGLILYQMMADTLIRAPTVIISNPSYVKKVVFPLDILIPVALTTSLVHAGFSLLVLAPFLMAVFGGIPWTAILLPLIVAPLCLVILGLGWLLASLGTYVRDIGQFIGPVMTAMLFMAPIFFPVTALPEWLQPWIVLNPLTLPVEQAREVLIFGNMPDWKGLGIYYCASLAICLFGFAWFRKTRKGFADVL